VIDPLPGLVEVERTLASGMCTRVNLAILDAYALEGLLGRGFHQPPASLFAPA